MDLQGYLRIIRRSWILISTLSLAGVLCGGTYSVLVPPTYTSSTQLFVALQSTGTAADLQQGNTFSQARVQSYVKTVKTPVVLEPVVKALGLGIRPEDLAQRVQASSDPNTVIINISVSDGSPAQASATAEAIANSLIKVVDTLEKPRSGGESPLSLSVITPAVSPDSPSSPNTRLNLALGLFFGVALGLGIAILRAVFDTRVRGESDVQRITDAPMLGVIPFDSEAVKKPLLPQAGTHSPRAEAFRQLRTNLQFANIAGKAKIILVTSSLPGEGKSTTATNLAISLAEAGQTVCLVDADLRRPMVNEYLGLDRNAGLTTALVRDVEVTELLQRWGNDNLFVLTSGQIPPNPSELLSSAQMQDVLAVLEQAFDTVIIDAPPLLPVTDAAALSQHVGGVVLVAGALKIKQQDLDKALRALAMVQAVLLGIVVNRAPKKGPDGYAYSYYGNDREGEENFLAATPVGRRPGRNSGTSQNEPSGFEGLLSSPEREPQLFRRRQ